MYIYTVYMEGKQMYLHLIGFSDFDVRAYCWKTLQKQVPSSL